MEEIIALLIAIIDEFLQNDQEKIDWETKSTPEIWSKKEVMGHLVDSAEINLHRFVRCTYEENFKLIYAQNEWVAAKHYQETDIKEILDLWLLLNRQIIRVLGNYPSDRLQTACDTGKNGVQLHSVEWLASDYVRHVQHHLIQVVA